ncbi:RagB/SusD family nutrient uptake outer membrane protein [Marinifilum sp.]|uniref:RagB/SusD family nutrient uptake outer membrane protein n=1 Tax=Marinifilum sp. TaxID=2033137 RepID=UPI003BA95726
MKKYCNNIYQLMVIASMIVISGLTACTDDLEGLNDNPLRLTEEKLAIDYANVGAFLPQMQQSIYYNNDGGNWKYQLQQNLNADIYSGYLCPPTPFRNGKNASNYFLVDWFNWPYKIGYSDVMGPWSEIKELTRESSREFYGASLILKVAAMHRVTDVYGPTPYSEFGKRGQFIEYDSQEEIYNQFFSELDTAVNLISTFYEEYPEVKSISKFDFIYGGDFSKWLKWANSLRLRLAIRVSNVDPALAKIEGEKALSNAYGLLETNDDIVQVDQPAIGHPLSEIAYSWGDTRMGANMESILVGFNDPRLAKYFAPATDENVIASGDVYKGIRYGIDIDSKDDRVGYSNIGEAFNLENKFSVPWLLMSTAEVYFLKAEAGLRGWANAGSIQNNYETGIRMSMEQWAAEGSVDDYINNDSNKPIDYKDTKFPEYDEDAVSEITIKWDEGASNEVKLERIITQKWIAMFPEGAEAWSEFRRTGYPKLLPLEVNYSNENTIGKVPNGEFIKRLPFNREEYDNNIEGVESGIEKLGGSDNAGVRLWWDTGSNNL